MTHGQFAQSRRTTAPLPEVTRGSSTEIAEPRQECPPTFVERETAASGAMIDGKIGAQPPILATQALVACHGFKTDAYFRSVAELKRTLFTVAAPAFEALAEGGEKVFEEAVAMLGVKPAGRRPYRNRPALLAVQLAVKPRNLEEQKQCSGYAAVLVVGHAIGKKGSELIEWASTASVDECRREARDLRSVEKKRSVKADEEPARAFLSISVVGGKKTRFPLGPQVADRLAGLFDGVQKNATAELFNRVLETVVAETIVSPASQHQPAAS